MHHNKLLFEKIKESLASVLPITAIVLVISVTIAPLTLGAMIMFVFGAILLILGMGLFTLGVDMSMIPMGDGIGVEISKSRRIGLPLLVCGILYMCFCGTKLLPDKDIEIKGGDRTAEYDTKKMVLVALIFIGVLVAMATSIVPMHIAGVIGAILVVVTGCISLEEAIKAFPTSTIFIVGGIFPLSKALVSSGAAEYLVNAISPVLSNLPPIVLLGAITFLMLLTTQFLMNSSATVLVLPIAIMLCQAAGINPLAGAMSVSVCASGAFVTPFGTAPNLLVWEAGGYSVKDYLKCGFPMLIIFGVVTTALCAVFYL